MRPDFEKSDKDTVAWHGKRLKKTPEEILTMWKTYPSPTVVWPEFIKYTKKYHIRQDRQSMHTAPIAAGANIRKFDIPIVERYQEQYGDKTAVFSPRDRIDLIDWFFPWFENNGDVTSYSMDNMRDYFGMSKDNAHDALQDVKDCAHLLIRFMKLHRATAEKVKFKGAFKR
jgi:DNA polymerase III epsilon subunit-like protein